jgi:peptidoglycan/LPS O-acetylase OafA/YrhL
MTLVPRGTAGVRYRSLDLWRGVACLSVAIFHSSFYLTRGPQPGLAGWQRLVLVLISHLSAGVPLFFVISGYCISASCDKVRRGSGSLWSNYFWRRLRRIFPPFWAMFAVTVGLALGVEHFWPGLYADHNNPIDHPATLTLGQWLANLSLTEGLRPNLGPPEQSWLMRPAWTLAYEEQFYLMMGLLLFLSRKHFFRNALIATLGILGCVVLGKYFERTVAGLFFNRWAFFAAGILVYWALQQGAARARWLAGGVFALALVGLALPFPLLERWNIRTLESVTAFAFALALLLLHRQDERLMAWSRAGLLKGLNWCGYRCYSIYLVHWPLVKLTSHAAYLLGVRGFWPTLLLTVPFSLAVVLVGGGVFHHLVERHFLRPSSGVAGEPVRELSLAEVPRAGVA